MNYRHAQLMSPQSLGASGTKVLPINVRKPISRIHIRYTITKTVQDMLAGVPACIPKIELVDGSHIIHALTGYENQALAYYSRDNIAMEHGQHISTLSEVSLYSLDFGRWLWDEELAFDPLKFDNPELKITYNRVATDVGAAVDVCEVWGDIFDEKAISPIGYLLATEHYDFTPAAAAGFEEISLPDDHPIRQMLVRAYMDAHEPWDVIDQVRLDEGTLDVIPFDYTSMEYYFRRMKAEWKCIHVPFQAALGAAAVVYYIPQTEFWAAINGIGMGAASTGYETTAAIEGGRASLIGQPGITYNGESRGYLPWHCFQFPMGKLDKIDDWYDPKGKKPRLRLHTVAGAQTGGVQLVLEELARY